MQSPHLGNGMLPLRDSSATNRSKVALQRLRSEGRLKVASRLRECSWSVREK